jgi:hypothetical protein
MRGAFPSTVVVILTLAHGLLACTGDDTSGAAADASPDRAADSTLDSTAAESAVSIEAPPQQLTALRLANWSPGAPGVDLCLAPQGTTVFQGPLLAGVVAALVDAGTLEDAGPAGLAFPQVGAYFGIAPGQYDARIVAAGSLDCSVGLGADSTGLPDLKADGFATLAVVGEAQPAGGGPALAVVGFPDEGPRAFAPNGATRPLAAKFVNAAAGVPIATASIATKGAGTFTLVAPFGGVGRYGPGELGADDPPIDADGYASWQVMSDATVTCAVPGQRSALASGTMATLGGATVTLVLVGSASGPAADGGLAGSFQLMECEDNAGTPGLLSSCAFVPVPAGP